MNDDLENIPEKQRSKKQQAGIQLYARQLADKLNEAGVPYKVLLANLEIDHSEESIKSIFREIGRVKYGKSSTSKLTTKECMGCYEEINRITSGLGLHIPWPSWEQFREYN